MTQKKRKPPARPTAGSSRPSGGATATQSSAQKRLAAQRAMAAASGQTSARRKRLMWAVGAPIVAVIVIVVVIIAVSANSGGRKVVHTPVAASAAVSTGISTVSASTYDTVGLGNVSNPPTANSGGAALTDSSGKPRILYVGAEYCPYCAAERWAIATALARFGTFSGLDVTYSSSTDVNPNTPTLSFGSATYTSSTISASLNEIEDGNGKTIKTLDSADDTLFKNLGGGSFPFVDIGGKYIIKGASFDGSVLAGKTPDEVAAILNTPTNKITQAVIGTANYITAAICASTNQQPSAVCSSSGVTAAAAKLGISTTSGPASTASPSATASS